MVRLSKLKLRLGAPPAATGSATGAGLGLVAFDTEWFGGGGGGGVCEAVNGFEVAEFKGGGGGCTWTLGGGAFWIPWLPKLTGAGKLAPGGAGGSPPWSRSDIFLLATLLSLYWQVGKFQVWFIGFHMTKPFKQCRSHHSPVKRDVLFLFLFYLRRRLIVLSQTKRNEETVLQDLLLILKLMATNLNKKVLYSVKRIFFGFLCQILSHFWKCFILFAFI